MATMDITPQELRDIEIREAWRGYHRDDVDELLERAAATIEHLEGENSQLRARIAQGPQSAASLPTPAPQPVAQVAPVAPVAPSPPPARMPDTDVIQRTLVLAQKAADEAVAEAKTRASQIVSESEAKANQLVADAEASARRIAETEKRRLEEEIGQLTLTRDTLSSDIDALETFEREYRERLHAAIDAELELLVQTSSAGVERPVVHEVDVPAPAPSWSASQEGAVVPEPASMPPAAPASSGPPTVHIEAVPAYQAGEAEGAWDPAPAGGWDDAPTASVVDDSAELDLVDDDQDEVHGDSLDDDAFFASLREAVRDDAPLGPGQDDDDTGFFDQDDTDEHKRLFKRRR